MYSFFYKLPNEIIQKINKLLIIDYSLLFNRIRKKRIEKEIINYYNFYGIEHNLTTSNPYDEINQLYSTNFELNFL